MVMNYWGLIVSEHPSATAAERAATAGPRAGDELVLYDRYHRCHTVRLAPTPESSATIPGHTPEHYSAA